MGHDPTDEHGIPLQSFVIQERLAKERAEREAEARRVEEFARRQKLAELLNPPARFPVPTNDGELSSGWLVFLLIVSMGAIYGIGEIEFSDAGHQLMATISRIAIATLTVGLAYTLIERHYMGLLMVCSLFIILLGMVWLWGWSTKEMFFPSGPPPGKSSLKNTSRAPLPPRRIPSANQPAP